MTTPLPSPSPASFEPTEPGDDVTEHASRPSAPSRPSREDAPWPGAEPWPDVGRYQLRRFVGAGGMGAVYEAVDPSLDRPVAIKVLSGKVTEQARLRMEREARALARLSHPHVVQVYEIGRAEDHTFIAMELVRGQTLDAWQRPFVPWRRAVEVYLQAGRGLAAAHAEGLVHRDFKPHNCMLGDDGRVRVLDFGLARAQGQAAPEETVEQGAGSGDPEGHQLTRTGAFVGTPAYVSLEQLEGGPVDAKSDQFSFCVSLYEAIYGQRPFAGQSAVELARALMLEELRPIPSERRVPAWLRRAVLRGLHREPDARWPSMDALLDELQQRAAPRRLRVAGALLGAGLLATGFGLWRQAHGVPERCGGAQAELQGVWDDARREQVSTALRAVDLPWALDTEARVSKGLDAYAHDLVAMHEQTCEATHVHGQQTEEVMALRMACLGSRRIALREAVDVLTQADADVLEHAVVLVADLPRLAACEDVEALRAEVPPPDDPEVERRVRELRAQLARVTALGGVGHFEAALEAIEPLVGEAEALGYPPLRAELLARRGVLRHELSRQDEAVADLEQAFSLAVEHRHDRIAIDASVALTFVVGAQLLRYDRGRQWGATALAFARRLHDASAEASALINLGLVRRHDGDLDGSLADLQAALAIKERVLGPRHPHVAVTLGGLAAVYEAKGDPAAAAEHLRRALAIDEEALGPEHPHLATHRGNLGRLLARQGQVDEGLAELESALATYERAGDRGSAAAVLGILGQIEHGRGRIDRAVAHLTRASQELEAAVGSEHPMRGTILGNLAMLRFEQGDLEAAIELQRRALAIAEAVHGRDGRGVVSSAGNLGILLRTHGDVDEALRLHQRVLEILEREYGPDHVDVASSAYDLAETLDANGRRGPARAAMERAAAIYAQTDDPGGPEALAAAREWLASHPDPAGGP